MRPLTPNLFSSATSLVAESFFDNPAHVYMCPDATRRIHQLEILLGTNLRAQPNLDQSFCLIAGRRVDAMGFWTKVHQDGPSVTQLVRSGALRFPIALGVRGLRSAIEVKSAIGRDILESGVSSSAWYLNNMVVRANLRGTGVGTKLLASQLESSAEWNPEQVFVLSTQRKENLVFYSRLGFETVRESRVGTGANTFTNWTMLRNSGA